MMTYSTPSRPISRFSCFSTAHGTKPSVARTKRANCCSLGHSVQPSARPCQYDASCGCCSRKPHLPNQEKPSGYSSDAGCVALEKRSDVKPRVRGARGGAGVTPTTVSTISMPPREEQVLFQRTCSMRGLALLRANAHLWTPTLSLRGGSLTDYGNDR